MSTFSVINVNGPDITPDLPLLELSYANTNILKDRAEEESKTRLTILP